MMDKIPPWPKIIFFDGVCILCNRTVDFLIRKDKRKELKFASLQSPLAKRLIPEYLSNNSSPGTVIFLDHEKIYSHSAAILRIMRNLPFPYNSTVIFLGVPVFLRDWIYNFIAKNRYRWFGKLEICRMPDIGTKERILE